MNISRKEATTSPTRVDILSSHTTGPYKLIERIELGPIDLCITRGNIAFKVF